VRVRFDQSWGRHLRKLPTTQATFGTDSATPCIVQVSRPESLTCLAGFVVAGARRVSHHRSSETNSRPTTAIFFHHLHQNATCSGVDWGVCLSPNTP
jgi:hypothetical protein